MLFKILRGPSSRISKDKTEFHDGYAYFTPDDGGFYIDAATESTDPDGAVQQKRIRVNPVMSVNGKAGDVALTASDVEAVPSTLTGTAGQVLTKTADGQQWADIPLDANTVQIKTKYITTQVEAISIAYGNDRYVAVGSRGRSSYSLDGISWTEVDLPAVKDWGGVCYGSDKFVAMAITADTAAYSTDGTSWTQITMPTNTAGSWRNVVYGNGTFVAIPQWGVNAAYSTDGLTWTLTTLPTVEGDPFWQSVAYGNGKFVAVGGEANVAVYSADGITWETAALPSTQDWYSVAYGNNKFVAITYGSDVAAYSADGIAWTQTTMPSSSDWYSLTYGGDKFVAISESAYNTYYGVAAYSTDGITWVQSTLPEQCHYHPSIAYGNNLFVAVNSQGRAFITSDGIDWQTTVERLLNPYGIDVRERVRDALGFEDYEADIEAMKGYADAAAASRQAAERSASNASSYSGSAFNYSYNASRSEQQASRSADDAYSYSNNAMNYRNDASTYASDASNYANSANSYMNSASTYAFNASSSAKAAASSSKSAAASAKAAKEAAAIATPTARKITLTAAGWDSTAKTQTVTCTGVLADGTAQEIHPMPVSAALDSPYIAAGVQCIAQAENSLTFACSTVPTADIEVYVIMQNITFIEETTEDQEAENVAQDASSAE